MLDNFLFFYFYYFKLSHQDHATCANRKRVERLMWRVANDNLQGGFYFCRWIGWWWDLVLLVGNSSSFRRWDPVYCLCCWWVNMNRPIFKIFYSSSPDGVSNFCFLSLFLWKLETIVDNWIKALPGPTKLITLRKG